MDPARSRNPAGRAGLLGSLLGLISALVGFLEGRAALIARDSKVALVHAAVLAAFFAAAIVLCGFGYIFLVVSAIFGLARLTGISWVWLALLTAVAHFGAAVAFALVASARLRRPLFRATASELKKDREWLKSLDQTTRPSS